MRKNVAGQKIGAQMITAADGTVFTGAVTAYVTGDAGTQAAGSVGSGACAHEGNGYHTYAPATAETDYDLVAFTFIGTGAVAATVQIFTSFPQTGDNFARIGAAGAGLTALGDTRIANLDATISSRASPTNITAGTITTVTNLTNLPSIPAGWLTATGIAADAITAAKIADGAIDAATFAAGAINAAAIASDAITDAKVSSDVTIASVTGAVGSVTGLTAANVGSILTIANKLDTALVLDGAVYQYTANALELAPTGGSAPTTDQIAEAMFTFDATATYASANAGSVVKQIADNAGGSALTAAAIADEVETRTIAGVTLVATTTNLTNLPTIPTDWIAAAGVKADAVTKIQNGLATPTNITAGTITTVTNLTNAPTSGDLTATMKTSVTTAASAATPVATVSGDLSATMKTSVTTAATAATPTVTLAANAITAAATAADFTTEIQSGLATSAALVTAQADLDNIQTRIPAALVGGRMDSSTGAINGDADAAATSAILNGATIVYRGTVTGAATTSTLIDSGLTESDVDHWKGRIIVFTSVITRQATSILAFNPTTDQLTFDPTTQAPTGATFVII